MGPGDLVPSCRVRGARCCSATITPVVPKGARCTAGSPSPRLLAVLCLLSWPVLPLEHAARGPSSFAKSAASFYSVFFNVRADVNTLTHEKYVPQSFHILAGRVRKIMIITRNCIWVNGVASWPQGTQSAACPSHK